jgi:hypothetical protein
LKRELAEREREKKRVTDVERDNRDRSSRNMVTVSRMEEHQGVSRGMNERRSSDQRSSRGQQMDIEMSERSVQYQDRDVHPPSSRGSRNSTSTSSKQTAVMPPLKNNRNILSSQNTAHQSQNSSSGKSKRIVIIK